MRRAKIKDADVTGLKCFDQLAIQQASELKKYVPTRIDVTGNGGGDTDERAVLERTLEPNRCYVKDRGYTKFISSLSMFF